MRDPEAWSLARKIGFLVLAIFLGMRAAPSLITSVPLLDELFMAVYEPTWGALVDWVGPNLLGTGELTILPNGSGDTTWNYVEMFTTVALALVFGVSLALVDRRRPDYRAVDRWLRIGVRYSLALTLFGYGLYKVFKLQFPFPGLMTLTQTFGESSPMKLAWTFMGYSTGYNVFTGGAEILAALLLLWRRTATLGALVAIGVMSNVVALNFCYDIPVKLFSSTLLLMAVYVAWVDLRRLAAVFFFNRPTQPADMSPHVTRRWARITRVVLKVIVVGMLAVQAFFIWDMSRESGDHTRPPLYGLYDVEAFTLGGEAVPPTDGRAWERVSVEAYGVLLVRQRDGTRRGFMVEVDAESRSIALTGRLEEAGLKATLRYEEPAPDRVILRGEIGPDAIEAALKRRDLEEMLLVSRGFRWVNEFPFNR